MKVVYTGLGPVTGSDANLAAATGAALLCFNLAPPEPAVASVLSAAGVALLQHNVIYRLLDEMQARLAGLAPEEEVEVVVGRAEVRLWPGCCCCTRWNADPNVRSFHMLLVDVVRHPLGGRRVCSLQSLTPIVHASNFIHIAAHWHQLNPHRPTCTCRHLPHLQVLATFPLLKSRRKEVARIAGCKVLEGSLQRGPQLFRLVRDGQVVFEGACCSIKRQKLEVDAAGKGTECGVVLGDSDWADVQAGDVLLCIRKETGGVASGTGGKVAEAAEA